MNQSEVKFTKGKNKACGECGATYRPRSSQSNYCSRKCANVKANRARRKAEVWWVNQKGYTEGRVWVGDRQIRVKQHRYVFEQHLGRKLLPHEDVHHIDGNKQNNAISNLTVLPHGEHTVLEHSGKPSKLKGRTLNLSDSERLRRSNHAKQYKIWVFSSANIAKATPQPERRGE